jgi:hypothetical protein
MMLLTPHEILKQLGFDIPEEGVRINPVDGYLHSTSLRLIGKTMSVDSIPQADLELMHAGLAGIVAMARNDVPAVFTDNAALKLRATIGCLVCETYRQHRVD